MASIVFMAAITVVVGIAIALRRSRPWMASPPCWSRMRRRIEPLPRASVPRRAARMRHRAAFDG